MNSPRYAVIIEPLGESDGGGFLATVPDLPGCTSDGATDVEALDAVSRRFPGAEAN
jgi:predicted RNase H-like HicB family nuclease